MAITGAAEDLLDRAFELAEEVGIPVDVLGVLDPVIDGTEATANSGYPRATMVIVSRGVGSAKGGAELRLCTS